jgi:hypothetical protein
MSRRIIARTLGPLLGATLALASSHAYAFKLKTHLGVANEALASLTESNGQWVVPLPSRGDVAVRNPELVEALQRFPGAFRGGVLGPDAFPDLIAGQMFVHVNNGELECPGSGCVSSSVPLEQRSLNKWRSIDYGMYLLLRAQKYNQLVVSGPLYDDRLKAIAFAYGYISHMIGDGFAHSYVNEWVRGVFDIKTGRPGGLFGPITEELQHIAIEGYMDAHVDVPLDKLKIEWPSEFLAELYTSRLVGNEVAGALASAPGEFGGPYFTALVKVRNAFADRSHSPNWGQVLPGKGGDIAEALIKLRNTSADILTLGTGFGDPVKDIEGVFKRRKIMFDTLLKGWVDLSGCIAQNLVNGTATQPGVPLRDDACQNRNFESNPDVAKVFQGQLNAAARFGEQESLTFDYGSTANNVKKASKFALLVGAMAIKFDPFEDIASLNKIKTGALAFCEAGGILKNNDCTNACQDAKQVCKEVLKVPCPLCPSDCDGFINGGLCSLTPHCFACVKGEKVIDAVCSQSVNAAIPICDFCTEHHFCNYYDAYAAIQKKTEELLHQAIEPLLAQLKEEAVKTLVTSFGGKYAVDFFALWDEVEQNARASKPAWVVNATFLKEDLTADPRYLERILQRLLGTSEALLSNAVSVADATAETAGKTLDKGRKVVQLYVEAVSGVLEERIWKGLIETLYRVARERDFDAVRDLEGDAGAWLDQWSFKSSDRTYETRYAKFLALVTQMNLLGAIRGPTATALHNDLALAAESDGSRALLNLYAAHPTHNAIQLTKIGFFGSESITSLSSPQVNFKRSTICSTVPHILCDVLQSLDDPNHYGHASQPNDEPNFDRSVAYWITRDWEWKQGRVEQGQCQLSPTDFPLSDNRAKGDSIYASLFLYPPSCSVPKFGSFEDANRPWTVNGAALGTNTETKSAGASSLSVAGCGWQPLLSPVFSTHEFGVIGDRIAFDLFIPTSQSNPYWTGDVQMFLSIPAAQMYNAHLGWQGLTKLPRGQWTTIEYTLTPVARAALAGDHPGAQFTIALNLGSCAAPLLIDNLRFIGALVSRVAPHQEGSTNLNVQTNSLFGFEQPGTWSSQQAAVALDFDLRSHGTASLSVPSGGWIEVASSPFATNQAPPVTGKMNIDVFIPPGQSNPWWVGDLSASFDCPSAGLYSVYLGNKPLTNLFESEFNSVVFDVPSNVQQALRASHTGCRIKLELNTSAGKGNFRFDRLGFISP